MILLLDIGNSRSKAAWFDGHQIWPGPAVDAAIAMEQLVGQLAAAGHTPDQVCVSNVRGRRLAADLRAAVRERWGLEPGFAVTRAESKLLRNGYVDHRQLGVDRWLAMLAARRRHAGEPLCVVDAGTAVTVDLIDPLGSHLGGFIVPGIESMADVLRRRSGEIARLETPVESPDSMTGPGRSTASAVRSGAVQAVAGLVDRALTMLPGGSGSARLLLTGGDAGALARLLDRADVCPWLVFEGLLIDTGLNMNFGATD